MTGPENGAERPRRNARPTSSDTDQMSPLTLTEGYDNERLAADLVAQVVDLVERALVAGIVGEARLELASGWDLVAQLSVVQRPCLVAA